MKREDAIYHLIKSFGEDLNREGLLDTPVRAAKAWNTFCSGYEMDPAKILATTFDSGGATGAVVLRDIPFFSTCEHHLLPFFGTATVSYIPGSRVVGVSKLARLVECFARRLQIQERLTSQIADAIEKHLGAAGVSVEVKAKHMCMMARGVNVHTAEMMTTDQRGLLKGRRE